MTNIKNKKAFSLIELSIVILIIGIIIAGITQSSRLVRQFKLSSARSQTQSSPVASIKDLGAWFEATLEDSFIETQVEDSALAGGTTIGTGKINTWYDINPSSSIKRTATGGVAAILPNYYANCINGLPCLRFDGSASTLSFDGTFLAGTDYTIFVVEQRRSAAANYFIGRGGTPSANDLLEFGYDGDTTLRFSHGDNATNYYQVGPASPVISNYVAPAPRVHTFVNATIAASATPFAHYLNGRSTASTLTNVGNPSLSTLASYSLATIGSSTTGSSTTYFTGDLGEIIFFTRALKNEERAAVEDYLLKKWGIASL